MFQVYAINSKTNGPGRSNSEKDRASAECRAAMALRAGWILAKVCCSLEEREAWQQEARELIAQTAALKPTD